MTTDDIEYLLAVAEHRNIGRAAEALGLTQPALTRAVARIETMAGLRLFTRLPKGVEPTPAGLAFLRRVQRMRIEFDDAMKELQLLKQGQLGMLRVGYSPSIDEDLIIGSMRQLLVERPAAQLQFGAALMQDLMLRLQAGELDLVIGPAPLPRQPGLDETPLYTSVMHVVADRRHPLCARRAVTRAELAAEPWALPGAPAALRRELEAAIAGADAKPLNVRVECFSLGVPQFRLLLGTPLLSLCSQTWLPQVRQMGLERLAVDDLLHLREIAALRRADAAASPLSHRLVELLQAQAAPRARRSR